ncbi:MAG: hypothetical protein F4153_11400 [Acidimicrobiia bacterium]|nr:hypothetical protein [Acidimicrobiia bacterium]
MSDIVQTTLIGLLGTGLLAIVIHYLRDLSTRISSLESTVKTMGTDVAAMGADMAAMGANLASLGTDVTKLGADVKTMGADIKTMGADIASKLGAQGQRIDRVYDILLLHGERLVQVEVAVKGQGSARPA